MPLTPVLERALAHPTEFGLERDLSEARSLQILAERGARYGAELRRRQEELRAYAAYDGAPERRAVAADIQRAALESGAM